MALYDALQRLDDRVLGRAQRRHRMTRLQARQSLGLALLMEVVGLVIGVAAGSWLVLIIYSVFMGVWLYRFGPEMRDALRRPS